MNFIGIIPARYNSSRFTGKPLCDILGKPMIWHVYSSVLKWDKWDKVYIATDDERIKDVCHQYSMPCIMTSPDHTDCLDRAGEVVDILYKKKEFADRFIIVQGDEPLFDTRTLDTDLSPSIVNFYTEVKDLSEIYDSNAVKVLVSKNQKAIYFSRYSVPYHDKKTKRCEDDPKIYKQIGVYSFSDEMLRIFLTLKSSYLENMEGIGLNRLIENGIDIYMRYTEYDSISVDTKEDKERIISLMKRSVL
ncbi:MAG: 3-deoxy-manno-octulosonate cytidylyltransferase [Candidatus Woesearchaeota archaeon]|jgi:3-deoxy-manno-octulosonate cytidylyltransferase (CMP-KDO synthetase)